MPRAKKPSIAPSLRAMKKPGFSSRRDFSLTSKASRWPAKLLCSLLFFLSGAAALIYQLVWIRQLSLVVGVEVYSITIAVSAFFAGLAAGSALFGRLADRLAQTSGRRWSNPLALYCSIELGIAPAGLAATTGLAHAARLYVVIQSRAGLLAWLLPFLLVGLPAFLMGGTLPVAVRSLTAGLGQIARFGGWVYATNTAGGIAGALLASFMFLPWVGVRGTAMAAAVFNLAAAAIAFLLNREFGSGSAAISTAPATSKEPTGSRTGLVLYAVAGGIALGYEVVWSQALAQFMSTRVFAFSVVLATYLAGLVIGSALYARFQHKVHDAWGAFAILISAAGLIALLEFAGLSLWQLQIQFEVGNLAFLATGSEFVRMCAQFLVASLGVVFVPTLLLGAAFPAALQLIAGRGETSTEVGRDVGALVAVNTAGGIGGTLFTGLFLIPSWGMMRSLSVLAIAAAMVAVLAVLLGSAVNGKMRWTVFAIALVAIAAAVIAPADRLSRLLLTTRGGGQLAFYEESRGATVAVAQNRAGDHVFRRLFVQGVSNSGDAMPSLRYMRLQAMLPLLIHRGQPKSALVIGFGTGITAGAVLHYPELQKRVCIELLPAVVRAGALFPENYHADSDPRLEIRTADGRQELLRSSDRYDVITLEPPPPSAQGVVNLYSTDFYRLAGKRLEPDGLFAQWLPLTTQNDEDTRALVRSFLDAFPFATLWTTELHEMLLIGSFSPIQLDMVQIADRFNQNDVSTALHAVGVDSPAALLATWVTGREGLERYAGNVRAVTDDYPRIEYASWVRPKEITLTLPKLLRLATEPPLICSEIGEVCSDIAIQRKDLLDFYAAGIAAYGGDRETWRQAMQRVHAAGATNPYYRWVAGEGN